MKHFVSLVNFSIQILVILVWINLSVNLIPEDVINSKERSQLKEVRKAFKNGFSQPIMNEDGYLVRFLRASNHEIDKTIASLRKNFAWRRENDVDNILYQDFTWWTKKYPLSLNMKTLDGHLVATLPIGLIDLRRHILEGRIKEGVRYVIYFLESAVYSVHNENPNDVMHGYVLANLAGFNLRTHGCLACIPVLIEILELYEIQYPHIGIRYIFINTPRTFQTLFATLKPFATLNTLQRLELFGYNSDEWRKVLLKYISEENLTIEYGGKAKTKNFRGFTREEANRLINYNRFKNQTKSN